MICKSTSSLHCANNAIPINEQVARKKKLTEYKVNIFEHAMNVYYALKIDIDYVVGSWYIDMKQRARQILLSIIKCWWKRSQGNHFSNFPLPRLKFLIWEALDQTREKCSRVSLFRLKSLKTRLNVFLNVFWEGDWRRRLSSGITGARRKGFLVFIVAFDTRRQRVL